MKRYRPEILVEKSLGDLQYKQQVAIEGSIQEQNHSEHTSIDMVFGKDKLPFI